MLSDAVLEICKRVPLPEDGDIDALPALSQQTREELYASYIAFSHALGDVNYTKNTEGSQEEQAENIIGQAVEEVNLQATDWKNGSRPLRVFLEAANGNDINCTFDLNLPDDAGDQAIAEALIDAYRDAAKISLASFPAALQLIFHPA